MSLGNRLYDRPDQSQRFGKLALYVSGSLPDTAPAVAYEGRLQIHNAIGDCWAELTNGNLPAGGSVTVDNDTHEVVVAWPAYSETAITVKCGDFEGPATDWILGAGWTIETKQVTPTVTSGTKAAHFRGAGESYIEAAAFYPLTHVQTSIRYSAMIQQGGSSKNNVRAAAALRFYDEDRVLLSSPRGNEIAAGSDGAWAASGGTEPIAENAAFVKPAIWGYRKRQNIPLCADDFTWDLQGAALGINANGTICIGIRVHDAGGRVADWAGCVSVNGLGAQLSDWKYLQTTLSDGTDYSAPGFDDSGWPTGTAPFGNIGPDASPVGVGAHSYDSRFSENIGTVVALDARAWIRRTMLLNEVPPGGFHFVGYFDNAYRLYINGALASDGSTITNAGVSTDIAASFFVAGTNVIAVRCDDDVSHASYDASYFDFLLDPVL